MIALALGLVQEAAPAEEVRSAATGHWNVYGEYSLADPMFLLALPLCALVFWYGASRRGRAAVRTPILPAGAIPRSWRQRLAWIPPLLQALALALGIVALARPLRGDEELTTVSEGVDIALVIDRSSSMQHNDLDPSKNRLQVVKEVVGDFAVRRMTDRVGAADNVALLTFAQYPELLCPFTLDSDALLGFLESVELVRYRQEDGTAIGVALAKAVALLRESNAKSKVVVLLTDGEENQREIEPLDAARMAAEEGIRVYTVLAGRYVYMQDWFGRVEATEQELDTKELEQIAADTGGRFFRARDRESLERVYEEIESLERTPREDRTFVQFFDLYPSFLLPAILLHALSFLATGLLFRRVP